jgi:hypothetical protein
MEKKRERLILYRHDERSSLIQSATGIYGFGYKQLSDEEEDEEEDETEKLALLLEMFFFILL